MATAPICLSCNLERTLVSKRPSRNRHEMQQYECPKCKSAFRLVVPRAPYKDDDAVLAASPLKTGAR